MKAGANGIRPDLTRTSTADIISLAEIMCPESGLNEAKRPNRLIAEKSPYLLQHAYNPVDWHPWGEEAFAKAKAEDKPIFLSIGYSTCHWCHVMAHESFEDPEVAALLNETFISIKVDREERPDIDSVYMTTCQMMTGGGGWPLTIIMTPDKRPFFAATYIPKEKRFGRMGLLELILRIKKLWGSHRDEVEDLATQFSSALREQLSGPPGEELGESALKMAYEALSQSFDERHGGFGDAPKFPTPHNLTFLLRYWRRTGEKRALEIVERTLQAMRRGGIYDHVGFGFHRYSTDAKWLLPHFEKMLYDQAMLAMAYIEAYQASKKGEYAETAREIFAYVLRELAAPEGGFYSAEDADSEGEEGKFYLWTAEELQQILGEEAKLIIRVFNVEGEGNFAEEVTGKRTGKNILHLRRPLAEIAPDLRMGEGELKQRLEAAREKLFAVREKRVHPHKDDKILTDWNGLMIAALAKGAQVLDEPQYAKAAARAADFILAKMRDLRGRLYHRYRDGEAAVPGFLDDYAFLIWGLVELYEATFNVGYLQAAIELADQMIGHFWDEEGGGFYFTADDAEDLGVRKKEAYDDALPSGNSAAMLDLLRLARLTADPELEEMVAELGRAFSKNVLQFPEAYTQLLAAVDFALGPSYEIVLVGEQEADNTKEMLKALRKQFIPNKIVLFRPAGEEEPEITRLARFTQHHASIAGKATAYVCLDYECRLPTTEPGKMLELLGVYTE